MSGSNKNWEKTTLFHGTDEETAKKIMQQGFNRNFSGLNFLYDMSSLVTNFLQKKLTGWRFRTVTVSSGLVSGGIQKTSNPKEGSTNCILLMFSV